MTAITSLWQRLIEFAADYRAPLLFVLAALAVALIVFMVRWLSNRQADVSNQRQEAVSDAEPEVLTWRDRLDRFRGAARHLFALDEHYYDMPWYIVVGAPDSPDALSFAKDRESMVPLPADLSAHAEHSAAQWRMQSGLVLIQPLAETPEGEQPSAGGRGMRRLINELRDLRPERPLDGVILSLPVDSLETPDSRIRSAEAIKQSLGRIERATSFVLPVYVVLTHAEALPGFTAFAKQHASDADQIFGWSNPHKLDRVYEPDWLTEAFDAMTADIRASQIKQAATSEHIADVDEFVIFDLALSRLREPLQSIVDDVLDEGIYDDGFYFRGVYFSGSAVDKTSAAPAFSRDLLTERIWPERNLARPTESGLLSANRLLRNYQIAVTVSLLALFGFGVFHFYDLRTQARSVQGSVAAMVRENLAGDFGRFIEIHNIMSQMSDMNADTFRRWSMPVSYLGKLDDKVVSYLSREKFGRIIYPDLECGLRRKLDDWVVSAANKNATITEFSALLDGLAELREHYEKFERISKPIDEDKNTAQNDVLVMFKELVGYAFGETLPAGFFDQSDLYEESLRKIDYEMGESDHCTRGAKHMLRTGFDAIWDPVVSDAMAVRDRIVASARRPGDTQNDDLLEFGDWLRSIRSDWLLTPAENPCRLLQRRLTDVCDEWGPYRSPPRERSGGSASVCPSRDDDISRAVGVFAEASCDVQFFARIGDQSYPGLGNLFTGAGGDLPELSPAAVEFADQFAALRELSFMQQPLLPAADIPASFEWSGERLRDALRYYREYENFAVQHFGADAVAAGSTSAALQGIVRGQLQGAIEQSLRLALVEITPDTPAALPVAAMEQGIQNTAENFSGVLQTLSQVDDVLQQLQLTSLSNWFTSVSQKSALDLLDRTDVLSAEPRPLYGPTLFTDWSKPSLLDALFDIPDAERLRTYLFEQRRRVSQLAFNYAKPPVTYLLNSEYTPSVPGESDSLLKWRETLEQLDKFQRSDPSSHLLVLETFFANGLLKTKTDCGFEPDATLEGYNDIFSRSYKTIVTDVDNYCNDKVNADVANDYLKVFTKFNNELSDKFPFAESLDVDDADADSVQAFFQFYAEVGSGLATRLEAQIEQEPRFAKPLEFVRAIDRLAAIFAVETPQVLGKPEIEVAAEFRAQPSEFSDQVITWKLLRTDTRESVERPTTGNDTLLWQVGSPVEIGLTWASRSTVLPLTFSSTLTSPDRPSARTVVFSEPGDWGLLRLIRRYGTSAAAGGVLLQLPVRLNAVSGEQTESFYVRLSLRGPKGESVPLTFPRQAPKI